VGRSKKGGSSRSLRAVKHTIVDDTTPLTAIAAGVADFDDEEDDDNGEVDVGDEPTDTMQKMRCASAGRSDVGPMGRLLSQGTSSAGRVGRLDTRSVLSLPVDSSVVEEVHDEVFFSTSDCGWITGHSYDARSSVPDARTSRPQSFDTCTE
jgi:hypothetical protein